tara:strand:+ start:7064 stop:7699 length:636 start_codon:yes stop_codon:yes gene_type:complete
MRLSEETAALWAALALAFGEMGAAAKTGRNPHFKSKYADSASVDAASRPALANNGIMVSQGVEEELGGLALVTYLIHGGSGQWMSQSVPFIVPRGKTEDPQAYGSALTYSRRYGLQSALGMVSDDDDGEAASRIARRPAPVAPPAPVEDSGPVPELTDLEAKCREMGMSPRLVEDFVMAEKGKSMNELETHEIIGLKKHIIENSDKFKETA